MDDRLHRDLNKQTKIMGRRSSFNLKPGDRLDIQRQLEDA